ncbi:MAG: 1-acyl-sn-glycerol-3-phosphate acyltransferase [Crocinitomicaceae bacterium]|nr:1-acyl-sn-glycerol-3-phosphate acyltransferase [Crocinitomicaceae bacterium]
MKKIFTPVYFLYKLWIGMVFWFTLLLLYPFFFLLLSRKQWFGTAFRLKRFWSTLFQWLLLCPVHRTLSAPLPKPPYIIVSNHSSYLDTVFMYSVIPDYFLFIGKGELLKWPLFGLFFRKQDIPVQRENNRQAYSALQKAYQALDRGECVAMYPEGTIPLTSPKMKSFKNGAFRMAMDKNVPLVPITWIQNERILKEPSRLFEYSMPRQVLVHIHAAILPEGTSEADLINLRNKVFAAIDSVLPPQYRSENENKP